MYAYRGGMHLHRREEARLSLGHRVGVKILDDFDRAPLEFALAGKQYFYRSR
jgi:hypothetical protein